MLGVSEELRTFKVAASGSEESVEEGVESDAASIDVLALDEADLAVGGIEEVVDRYLLQRGSVKRRRREEQQN